MQAEKMIQMEYRKALNAAERLQELAGQLQRISEVEMESRISDLKKAWTGPAAEQYMKKLFLGKTGTAEKAGALSRAADALLTAAKRQYAIELINLKKAESRES